MQHKVYNFSPGPCILPQAVFETCRREMTDWHGTGLSVIEMSHRAAPFNSIQKKLRDDLRILMSIPEEFEILFFQGGASQQFSAMCHNLLGEGSV
jgi:phosphoserine aminotransferase